MKITRIEPTKNIYDLTSSLNCQRRVAAYARVSTSSDEQLVSIEAQMDYYPKFIMSQPSWIFVGLYADEGLSGTSLKRRDEFNRMINDAISGKFDLIITKSISRFARNTVDTLTVTRMLKEANVEVYFEKEQIYSFDSKGEFMLTLLSSIAQEESRSISENVTWGHRKRMADGKYSIPYRRFLGYNKGANGKPEIVDVDAIIIRKIYRLFLEGRTQSDIASILERNGILSPGGKRKWQTRTISNILTNEKYYGAALLQKTFTIDFLTKKIQKNTGELPQYYVENDHDPIVCKEVFDEVEIKIRRARNGITSRFPFSNRIFCGVCGAPYGRKTDGNYANNKKFRRSVWKCNNKFSDKSQIHTSNISEEAITYAFHLAVMEIWSTHPKLYLIAIKTMLAVLKSDEYKKNVRLKAIIHFLRSFGSLSPNKLNFDESAWRIIIEKATVCLNNKINFYLIDRSNITINILKL